MNLSKTLLIALAISLACVPLWGQEEPVPEAEPYDPGEFSQGVRNLRRAEIIAVGSFPITFVFANLGYGLIRYGVNGWDNAYSPIGNPNQVPYSRQETIGVISAAVGLSITVALIDYFLGRAKARRLAGAP